MKNMTNRLIIFFAAVGLCAMIYAAWHYYQQQRAADAARAILSAPYPGDTFQNPGPPPRQP
jgi:hypothetical protein